MIETTNRQDSTKANNGPTKYKDPWWNEDSSFRELTPNERSRLILSKEHLEAYKAAFLRYKKVKEQALEKAHSQTLKKTQSEFNSFVNG
jgi:hypothetical protein